MPQNRAFDGSLRRVLNVKASQDTGSECVLLGDIGATNARLALLSDGVLGPVDCFTVADFARFTDAVDAFLGYGPRDFPPTGALLAAAGPIESNRCVLTNCPWTIEPGEIRAAFGFKQVRLVNDFEATALSLSHLVGPDLYPLGGGRAESGAPMAVLGPGTGLGVACQVPGSPTPIVIAGEGGHATMSATTRREDEIIEYLRQRFGHVSAERVVSGSGLENLYAAVAAIDEADAPKRHAAEITAAALGGGCPIAKAALDLFCAMLGTIAGNIALTFGARGGVYIAGGIAPRITEYLARSEFRARFEGKGRFKSYLEAIPVHVIVHPVATFLGLRSIVFDDTLLTRQQYRRHLEP
jgi:glucokinase